jgi:hypothetical protein
LTPTDALLRLRLVNTSLVSLFLLFALASCNCATSGGNSATGNADPITQVLLEDVQGLWGGQNLTILETGQATLQVVDRSRASRSYSATLTQSQIQRLDAIIHGNNFAKIANSTRPGIPDESRPHITVQFQSGAKHSVMRWTGDQTPEFAAVYNELLAIGKSIAGPDKESVHQ